MQCCVHHHQTQCDIGFVSKYTEAQIGLPHLDLIEVPLWLPGRLLRLRERGVVAEHQQPPAPHRPEGGVDLVKVQLGRGVSEAELILHVRVIQLADKRVGPGLGRVDGHVH
eukprot:scaffold64676_cov26-Prasinocladus_malaysianus.AAC.2